MSIAWWALLLFGVCANSLDCSKVKFAVQPTNGGQACTCSIGFEWNSKDKTCDIDCRRLVNAIGRNGAHECNCVQKFVWQPSMLMCVADCRRKIINYSVGRNNIGGCRCQSYYQWNPETKSCELACQEVQGSTGKRLSNRECECEADSVWLPDKYYCRAVKQKTFNPPPRFSADEL